MKFSARCLPLSPLMTNKRAIQRAINHIYAPAASIGQTTCTARNWLPDGLTLARSSGQYRGDALDVTVPFGGNKQSGFGRTAAACLRQIHPPLNDLGSSFWHRQRPRLAPIPLTGEIT